MNIEDDGRTDYVLCDIVKILYALWKEKMKLTEKEFNWIVSYMRVTVMSNELGA